MINKICSYCNKEFLISKWRTKRSKTLCCSRECKSKYQLKKQYPFVTGKCKQCGRDIIVKNADFDKPNRKFCSVPCRAKWSAKNIKRHFSLKQRRAAAKRARERFTGKENSYETRMKKRLANLGPKSHFWKGGLTNENRKHRNSFMYDYWRRKVYERDNYTCQKCGTRSGNGKAVKLNADHIKPWSTSPELRFEISNGRTLCLECHKKTDTFGYKAVINR